MWLKLCPTIPNFSISQFMKPEDLKKIARKPLKKRRRFERPRYRLSNRSNDRLPYPTRNAKGDHVNLGASDYDEFVDALEYPSISPIVSLSDLVIDSTDGHQCVELELEGQFFVASIHKPGIDGIVERLQIPKIDLETQGVQLYFIKSSSGVQDLRIYVGGKSVYSDETDTRLMQAGDHPNAPLSKNTVGVQTLVILGANDVTETEDITLSFNKEICVESDCGDENPGQFYTVASGLVFESSPGSGVTSSEKLQQTSMISSLPTDESIDYILRQGTREPKHRLVMSRSDPIIPLNVRTSTEDSQGTQIHSKQIVDASYLSSSEEISEYIAHSRVSRPITEFSSQDDGVNSYGQTERPMTTASDAVKSMHLALKPITDQINDIKNRMICMNIHPLKSEPIPNTGHQESVMNDDRNAVTYPMASRKTRQSNKNKHHAPSFVDQQDVFTSHRHFEPIQDIFDRLDHQSIVFNPFPLCPRKCVWSEPEDIFLFQ